jgi:AsmA protein
MIRKSIWGVIAVAIIAVLIVTMLPLIASTRIIRDRIALEMSAWSGYRVELGAAPEIQIWPTFKAVLNDVSLSDWDDANRHPVLDAESVELELSPIAALRGNVVFSRARLVRPVLYVSKVAPNRYAPTAPKIGRIWHAIEKAREALAKDPGKPNLSTLSDESFGTVEFSDGQVMDRNGGDNAALMTGLAGAVDWSALDSTARLTATGVWRGENFSIEAASAQPLVLFAGGSAPLSINVKAAPAAGRFDGTANLSQNSFFNGQVAFNSPSLRRMLEWSRNDLPPGAGSGSVALSGKVSGDRRRLKLDDAQITLNGNPASGVLELSLADAVPGFVGTLAFDQFDLRAFLSAFTPFVPGSDDSPSTIDVAFAEKYNLDLRLSANKATAGELVFTDFAATAQVKGDLAAFDISDSTIFGGTVQAGVRYDRKGKSGNLDIRLLASDIDTGAAAALAKSLRTAPAGKATVSLLLKGPAPDWDSFLQTAGGSFSMAFGPGTVNGFDVGDFLNRFKQGGFFPLRDVAAGTVNIDRAEVRATLSDGTARLEKAEATLGQRRLTLTGVVPYSVGGVALSGVIIPVKATDDAPDPAEASFFVGGSWSAPFVSPIFSDTYFDRPRVGQSD